MQDDDTGVAGAITEAPMGHTRVALIGNVDAGKSTLTGVISRDDLDDGRGKARTTIFCHEHEKKTGRTSCISTTLIGFTEDGLQIIPSSRQNERMKWAEISQQSRHTISLIDLCGHGKLRLLLAIGFPSTLPRISYCHHNPCCCHMLNYHLLVLLSFVDPITIISIPVQNGT